MTCAHSMSYIERVITGDERGAISRLIRLALWPLSLVYRAGLAIYLSLYSAGLRSRMRLNVPVISVGNLTFGGTGKTPAVQTLCRLLQERGKRVAVLSRGHGGSGRGIVVVSDGADILADAASAGDEPVMLARTLPGVPVVVGKDRRATGRLACETFRPDVIVLDDGLQYWQLHRDLDIIVIDAERPFGSGRVMPMGDLREPPGAIRRAGVVLINAPPAIGDAAWQRLLETVRSMTSATLLRCCRKPESLIRADTGEVLPLDRVSGRRVLAFCGIGRPPGFVEMLISLGARLEDTIVFGDHHAYGPSDVETVRRRLGETGADALVTTEKDLTRLAPGVFGKDLFALRVKLEIEESSRFADYVAGIVDGKGKAPPAV